MTDQKVFIIIVIVVVVLCIVFPLFKEFISDWVFKREIKGKKRIFKAKIKESDINKTKGQYTETDRIKDMARMKRFQDTFGPK